MHERTEKLHEIMAGYQLTANDVGRLLCRKQITVLTWRMKDTKKVIPAQLLELLEFKVKELSNAPEARPVQPNAERAQ